MRSFIEKLFGRKEKELNYVIREYKPSYEQALKTRVFAAELDELAEEKDEMTIDNLYQRQ
jgi:hypothetical protein